MRVVEGNISYRRILDRRGENGKDIRNGMCREGGRTGGARYLCLVKGKDRWLDDTWL